MKGGLKVIARKIDSTGRIHIPTDIRKTYGLQIGMEVAINPGNGCIILKPKNKLCCICQIPLNEQEEKDKICSHCLSEINQRHKQEVS